MFDITEMKRGDEKVAFLAYHDELTGLPTRAMFEELLEPVHRSGEAATRTPSP